MSKGKGGMVRERKERDTGRQQNEETLWIVMVMLMVIVIVVSRMYASNRTQEARGRL